MGKSKTAHEPFWLGNVMVTTFLWPADSLRGPPSLFFAHPCIRPHRPRYNKKNKTFKTPYLELRCTTMTIIRQGDLRHHPWSFDLPHSCPLGETSTVALSLGMLKAGCWFPVCSRLLSFISVAPWRQHHAIGYLNNLG